jgi:hypothetical protein
MEEISTAAVLDCPTCKKAVSTDSKFCGNCGYPIGGTEFEKNEFDYAYEVKRYDLGKAQEIVKGGATILYVLAGLILVVDLLVYFTSYKIEMLVVGILLPVIFLGLAQWSKKKPFTAMVVALVFYVTIILADAVGNPASIFTGIILKAIVIGALVKAIRGAREAQNIMQDLEARNWNQ